MNGCTCSASIRSGQPMEHDSSRCPIHSGAVTAPGDDLTYERAYAEMDRLDELIAASQFRCVRCFDRGIVSGLGETVACPRCSAEARDA